MSVERSTVKATDQQRYEMMLRQVGDIVRRDAFTSECRDVLALMVKGHALTGFEQAVRLAERQEAARLLFVVGYSFGAIAAMSGLTRGAVLSLLHRR